MAVKTKQCPFKKTNMTVTEIFTITANFKSMQSAQLIHSKTCRSINKESEIVSDRELFSELFETPIHPLLINIVPPFVNESNRMFRFQLNGEALWRWREVFRTNVFFVPPIFVPPAYTFVPHRIQNMCSYHINIHSK